MTFTVSEHELGTPEATWLSCPWLAACPELRWPAVAGGRVVVIAPHPDDEVLAVGGTMVELARSGAEVTIVAVTDGEGSHPGSTTITPDALRARRADERRAALERLGLGASIVTRLAYADGGVARARDLEVRLRELVEGTACCLAPWERDGHPDHDEAGRAAKAACAAMDVPLLQYPVWAWHWAKPDSGDLPRERVRRVTLDAGSLSAKRFAIAAYQSQISALGPEPHDAAVLPPAVVARFERPFEVLIE